MELLIYKKDGHILSQLEKGQRYIVKKEKTFFVGEYTGQNLYFTTLDGKDISLITRSNTISPNVKIVECYDDLLRNSISKWNSKINWWIKIYFRIENQWSSA